MSTAHVDVLIVGAGLSGIGAAYYLQTRCPTRSYVILEADGPETRLKMVEPEGRERRITP